MGARGCCGVGDGEECQNTASLRCAKTVCCLLSAPFASSNVVCLEVFSNETCLCVSFCACVVDFQFSLCSLLSPLHLQRAHFKMSDQDPKSGSQGSAHHEAFTDDELVTEKVLSGSKRRVGRQDTQKRRKKRLLERRYVSSPALEGLPGAPWLWHPEHIFQDHSWEFLQLKFEDRLRRMDKDCDWVHDHDPESAETLFLACVILWFQSDGGKDEILGTRMTIFTRHALRYSIGRALHVRPGSIMLNGWKEKQACAPPTFWYSLF
jgi:hypothetical protein